MILWQLIGGALSGYVGLTTAYLLILTLAAWRFRKSAPPQSSLDRSLLVVVPAHNESREIRKTVRGILGGDYPADRFSVGVIADNCDDDTADQARDAGAQVLIRQNPGMRGKGQALDWFFRHHTPVYSGYDIVVILDADTLPHPGFLREMATSFSAAEVQVVQGFYGVSNPGASWRTALISAALCVFHHVRTAGRYHMGGSAGLKGNGMGFRSSLLAARGWPAHSIVEDLEFSTLLVMDGIRVHYNPDAVVYGEMASRGDQAVSQRKRWEGGRLPLVSRHLLPLLVRWLETRKILYLDAAMELLIPPLALLVAGQILMILFPVWGAAAGGACLAITLFYVVSGLILKKASLRVWLSLAWAPVYILWKIPVYLSLAGKKASATWERTRRESETNP